jgi:hyperosmotically inducible protein
MAGATRVSGPAAKDRPARPLPAMRRMSPPADRAPFAFLWKGHIMKSKLAITCVMIGSMLAPVIAHATDSDSDRAHPVTFVKDSVITTKVKAKLAAEHPASLAQIKVDTDRKGHVFLSGTVGSQADADKAVSIATATDGVTAVSSTIRVKKDD